jgi:hypothetical protein
MTDADEAVALAELDAVSAATPAVLVYPRADTPPVSTAWYCSVFEWRTPNGWTIRVFNDCGEWDYVEELEAPDGRVWLYPHFVDDGRTWNALTEKLADWSPKPENEGGWPHIDECPP